MPGSSVERLHLHVAAVSTVVIIAGHLSHVRPVIRPAVQGQPGVKARSTQGHQYCAIAGWLERVHNVLSKALSQRPVKKFEGMSRILPTQGATQLEVPDTRHAYNIPATIDNGRSTCNNALTSW